MVLKPGTTIERYVVDMLIGEGGMAVVYRVHHLSLRTAHALKVLKLNHPSIRERLVQEGWVQASLRHPNVVAVTDILDVHGSPGLLMEYVAGPGLDAYLSSVQPTIPAAEKLFGGILSGIEAAHALGFLHRDLKPANILLHISGTEPCPKITDFGLAKVLSGDSPGVQRTRSGLPMGTPQYMAPEQFRDARSVDQRTDIFALGCVLYQLLTGRLAFPGSNFAETFTLVMAGRYRPPREFVPELPERFCAAIAGCLESNRERRIASCTDLRAVLDGRTQHPVERLAPALDTMEGWGDEDDHRGEHAARGTAVPVRSLQAGANSAQAGASSSPRMPPPVSLPSSALRLDSQVEQVFSLFSGSVSEEDDIDCSDLRSFPGLTVASSGPETADEGSVVTPPEPQAESVSRSYRLISTLGQGGFGSVYRGELRGASGFSKQVAIKLLNAEANAVEDFKARLRDEARLLGLLRHRAIVHLDDLVQIEGQWAVVMEYVEGADLKELLTLGPLPPRPTCELAAEVCSALHMAHQAKDPRSGQPLGIVHRDIKPANIRLTPSGEVKVLDFGVALATFDDREAMTRSMAFGSMGYLAPERIDGCDTPAADVYSLGVVVLEALTGETVGQLSVNPRSHAKQVGQRLEALSALSGSDFWIRVADLLQSMLAYHHEERPTAGEVTERFRDLLLVAPGQWLARWAPDAMSRLASSQGAVEAADTEITEETGWVDMGPGALNPPAPVAAAVASEVVAAPSVEVSGPSGSTSFSVPRRKPRVALAVGLLTGLVGVLLVSWFALRPEAGEEQPSGNGLSSVSNPASDEQLKGAASEDEAGELSPSALAATALPGTDEPASTSRGADAGTGSIPAVRKTTTGPAATSHSGATDPQTAAAAVASVSQSLSPDPAPAPIVVSAPAPAVERIATAPPVGKVVVQGDIVGARLYDADGQFFPPGELPPGRYRLRVAFATGSIDIASPVVVKAGRTTTLRCDAVAQACR